MIIRRGRRLHIQPRSYEHIEASAEIEFDTEVDVPEGADVDTWADDRLTALLAKEVEEAALVSDDDSFIAEYRYTETDK